MTEPKRTRRRGPPEPTAAAPSAPGEPAVTPLAVRPNATLAEFAREWLKRRDKRTLQADTERLRNHVLHRLGGVRLRELGASQVTAVVREMLAKKGMTVKSARNAYAVFDELIAEALALGLLGADPRALPADIWPEPEAARPVFEASEVEALVGDERLAEAQRLYNRVAFDTGLPSAVLVELTFADWRARLEAPPSPELELAIEVWRAQGFERSYGRAPAPSDRLLPRPASTPEPHTEGSAFKAFRRACVAVGVKTRSPAAIRNTFEARRGLLSPPAAAS